MEVVSNTNNEESRGFAWFLQQIANGAFHQELSEGLRDLNAALNQHVQDFGGQPKGKINIQIGFKLDKGVFQIEASQEIKKPKRPGAGAIMWSTPGNNFTPNNPRQLNMFNRDGTKTAAE